MIFIKKLTIENYKCFENEPIDFHVPDGENEGSGLNILIGENGNGKTTILEAINYLTLNSYSAENKLSINDFNDHQKDIVIQAETEPFECKSTIGFYKDWSFQSNGMEFSARNRNSKARGKLLSSPYETHNYFQLCGKYKKKDGSEGKDIDSRDKIFNNGNINDDEINVFYFDKNRTRQIATGNYKTTFERICDDLNWKFAKGIDDDNREKMLENISGEYFNNVIEIAQKGTGKKVASALKDFFGNPNYEKLKIELINLLHPFSNSFFALREEDSLQQINVRDLGSGIEIILTLLLLKSIANESKGSIIYLIDEPELHLHPKAQDKLLELLIQESKNKQIFVSTHSPYMFKNCLSKKVGLSIFNKDEQGKINIRNARDETWGIFPWSPSWGEINFYAYDLATVEFHNELYGYIQEKEGVYEIKKMDNFLADNSIPKSKQWIRVSNGNPQNPSDVTLCTYIRNMIHHPENVNNLAYTDKELTASINELIRVI